jgi:high-affinity K+ transport system ATPase subunit B
MRKVISNITKQVKKFKPASLLQNKVLLYIVAAIAIVHILLLANSKDFNSVLIFVIVGFLISFFSKNMIVVLLSAIIFTNLIKMVYPGQEGMKGKKVKEGLEHEDEEEEEEELYDEEEEKKEEEEDEGVSLNIKQTAEEKKEAELKKKQETYDKLKNDFNEFQSIQHDILKNMKEIDPLLTKAENFIAKFEQFKKN